MKVLNHFSGKEFKVGDVWKSAKNFPFEHWIMTETMWKFIGYSRSWRQPYPDRMIKKPHKKDILFSD